MLSSSMSSPLSFDFFISFSGSTFVSNFSMPSSALSSSGFIVVVDGGLGLGGSPGWMGLSSGYTYEKSDVSYFFNAQRTHEAVIVEKIDFLEKLRYQTVEQF